MQDRNGRNARRAKTSEVVEGLATESPVFDLVLHQVGPGAFHEVNHRQLLAQRQFLCTQYRVNATCTHCTRLDPCVIHPDQGPRSSDKSDAKDNRRPRDGGFGVVRVAEIARHAMQLQKGHTRIEQLRQPLARRQLPPRMHTLPALFRQHDRARLQRTQRINASQHGFAVLREIRAFGNDLAGECHHLAPC